MKSSVFRISLLALALVFALGAVPAFAVDRGPVLNDCTAFGVPLQNKLEAEALAAITAAATVPAFAPLTVTVDGRAWTLQPGAAFTVDAAKMLDAAYTTTGTIAPVYALNSTYIAAWVKDVAADVYVPARNARYVTRRTGVGLYKGRPGKRLYQPTAVAAVQAALAPIAAAGDPAAPSPAPLAFSSVPVTQRIFRSGLGKIIGVDLSERRIRLYSRGKRVRMYRIAVGTSSHPTPKGTFKITNKVKWPTWRNPGSDWAADMPASIGPSVSNPLGTRALYVSAPGIRIHGTTKRYSIGTAASHGCMRMRREDIEALYKVVPVGTKVHIVR